jgi:glycosyltransferase involved in cell wall biosynthesis
MLLSMEEHYGPLPRTIVIPNGRRFRHQPGVVKQPLVFSAGRLWDEAKNLRAVEEIAAALPWPVYVAGDCQHPDGGRRPCTECRFVGKLSSRQMAWWMDRASIFAAPVRYEPFGLAVLEAALAGCALVLGDVPSLREIWGADAVFVAPDHSPSLRLALECLIDSPALRQQLACKAHHRALQFSTGRMVAAYREAYASFEPASASTPFGQPLAGS